MQIQKTRQYSNCKNLLQKQKIYMKFKELLNIMPFIAWITDAEGNYCHVNKKFIIESGKCLEEIIGKSYKDVWNLKTSNECVKTDRRVLNTLGEFTYNCVLQSVKGEKYFKVNKYPIIDENGKVIFSFSIALDITEIKESQCKVEREAYTDSHTGVLNRRALYARMKERCIGKGMTMIIIDVDNFKYINDNYGHEIGDKILYDIAKILEQVFNHENVFRFGGDEFIVVLSFEDQKVKLEEKINKVMEEISNIFINERQDEQVNISIGVANCGCSENFCKGRNYRIIQKADIALYKAKDSGKNMYVIYTPELEEEKLFNANIESSLKKSVGKGEISLKYQPQYDKNNKVVGFESLLRWNNEQYSNITTLEIIHILEKGNLINVVGNEIIRQACSFAKKINEISEKNIFVSINVSFFQIANDDFVKNVKQIIHEVGVDTKYIKIEISEYILSKDIEKNLAKINELQSIGIQFNLDNFGRVNTSLSDLLKLSLSQVKIDCEFIANIEKEKYKMLTKLIVDYSHSFGINVVATCVETRKQVETLNSINIDVFQGNFFSLPLNDADAINLLKDNIR